MRTKYCCAGLCAALALPTMHRMTLRPDLRLAPSPEERQSTRIRPLWKPLGYERGRWGKRYWLLIGDDWKLAMRGGAMYGLSFLIDIYPDLGYWRALYPRGRGRKIDTHEALRQFILACERAGEYNPSATPAADTSTTPAASTAATEPPNK